MYRDLSFKLFMKSSSMTKFLLIFFRSGSKTDEPNGENAKETNSTISETPS